MIMPCDVQGVQGVQGQKTRTLYRRNPRHLWARASVYRVYMAIIRVCARHYHSSQHTTLTRVYIYPVYPVHLVQATRRAGFAYTWVFSRACTPCTQPSWIKK